MKPDDLGSTGHSWQGYRNALPAPPARFPQSYDQTGPVSAPMLLLYSGGAKEAYNSTGFQQQQYEPQPRRGSESVALSMGSKLNTGLTSHRSNPTLKRPYGSFEDHSYGPAHVTHDGLHELDNASKPTIQSDHRLLSFGPLPSRHTVVDQFGSPAKIDVAAQIHGMFFLSEMATHTGGSIVMQPELTCYRRNLFQISGSVTVPSGPISVLTERGETSPVVSQELSVSAIESVDGHVIRLIVIPWKTPPANSPEIPTGSEQEPAPIALNFESTENDKNNGAVSQQQIAWRRLQFRVATANNGRRKELQQHFVLRLKLVATLVDGSTVCIHESTTAPIVVRGRSPRNFQARKEIPLVGSSASPRGQASQVSPSQKKALSGAENSAIVRKPTMLDPPKGTFQFDASNFPAPPVMMRTEYSQWNSAQQSAENGTSATAPAFAQPGNSMAPYMSTPQSLQPGQDVGAPAPLSSQPPRLDHSSRQFYTSASSTSAQYDSNPRPTKSPRHSDASSSSLYQSFEAPYASALPAHPNASRFLYYSQGPASETWTSADHVSSNYATSMQPPAQQTVLPQQHPQQQPRSTHGYNYPAYTYSSTRDNGGQNIGYSWNPTG